MTTKHTPPMTVEKRPSDLDRFSESFIVVDSNGNFFAQTYSSFDANQIAALPDLLKALKDLLKEADLYANECRPKLTFVCEQAQAAISKAQS